MNPLAYIEANKNLASGFLLSAKLAWDAGDRAECDRLAGIAARYELEADRAQQRLESACCR